MDNKKNLNYRKILVINLGGIGDILLSIPALKALRNKFLEAKISILVVPRVYKIINSLNYIDNAFIFYKGYSPLNFLKNFCTLLILRREHFDLAINMRTLVSEKSAGRIKFLLDSINTKVKAGRDTEGRGCFFDVKIHETDMGEKHEMEYDIEIVEALGIEVLDKNIDFAFDSESFKKIGDILEKEGVSKDDVLIGLHPGGQFSHRWPIENFAKVIDELYKVTSCKFVVTGTKDEVSLTQKLIEKVGVKVINLTNKLDIMELSALIKRCSLYISNDTGAMHIAAILKTPLVAIFGPGYIIRFDPRNISEKTVVIYKKADCAPCNKVVCNSIKCLKAISQREVVDAALSLLKIYKDENQ